MARGGGGRVSGILETKTTKEEDEKRGKKEGEGNEQTALWI